VDIEDDSDNLILMGTDGSFREDLDAPHGKLGEDLRAAFSALNEDSEELLCTVISALGKERIVAYRVGREG
ncbi:hypothetical protein ADUPG1_000482, partial [Aduncisulcus paluster]